VKAEGQVASGGGSEQTGNVGGGNEGVLRRRREEKRRNFREEFDGLRSWRIPNDESGVAGRGDGLAGNCDGNSETVDITGTTVFLRVTMGDVPTFVCKSGSVPEVGIILVIGSVSGAAGNGNSKSPTAGRTTDNDRVG
jgi:hypothetical protein